MLEKNSHKQTRARSSLICPHREVNVVLWRRALFLEPSLFPETNVGGAAFPSSPSCRSPPVLLLLGGLFVGAVSRHERYTTNKTGKFGKRSRGRRSVSGKAYKNGGLGANAFDAEMGESI